jgi:hypothetical protein
VNLQGQNWYAKTSFQSHFGSYGITNEMARAIVLTSCEETVKYPQ